MEELNFNDLRKKKRHIGMKVSELEEKQIKAFCEKEQISISDLLRYGIGKAMKERNQAKGN